MKLPAEVRTGLEREVGPVGELRGVGGGCISSTGRVTIRGRTYFLKYDRDAAPSFFGVESRGLQTLAAAGSSLRIPSVIAVSEDADPPYAWILLEWLEPAGADGGGPAASELGKGLAELHRSAADAWGWAEDGYIGSLPQSNRRHSDWAKFWWRERLEPQLHRAREAGYSTDDRWEALAAALPDVLAPAQDDGPSLLHGDLWSGNVLHTTEGPALIDPAVYFGHREVDLAMAALFGGFPRDFFEAYAASWPLTPGSEVRRRVYQLYYLLVHVNLFGATYLRGTEANLNAILSRTGA